MNRLAIRWRVMLPVLLLLTILAPSLRLLPGGAYLPDLWLLAVLFLTSPPPTPAWRQAALLLVVAGLLRGSVTAVAPPVAWAGFALALLLRDLLFRRLRDDLWLMRLLTGFAAALPLALLDFREGLRLGAEVDLEVFLWRAALCALCWALLRRPPRFTQWVSGARR